MFRAAAVMLFALTVLPGSLVAKAAETYPSKVVRIITTQPGGTNDLTARLIAPGLGAGLGQQVIVDNRAGGVVTTEVAAKAPPDGHTLLLNGSIVWLLPLMRKSTAWEMFRDFAPVTFAVRAPSILVVHPSVPARSVKELIALARSRPGQLNYASAVAGSANHLTAELFKVMAGVNIVHVPYKGGGQALTGLLGGESDLMFALVGAAAPHIKSGRLRALAVTSAKPSALFPGVPAVSATVPGYESVAMFGLLSPAGTPSTIIGRLNKEILRVLDQSDVKERFFRAGVEVVGAGPDPFSAAIKAEMARMGKVIRDIGLRVD